MGHKGEARIQVSNIKSSDLSSILGSHGGSEGKESASSTGDLGSILGSGISLENGMATHSNILAWRIPWTEEPGGLQSTGSQKVRHD